MALPFFSLAQVKFSAVCPHRKIGKNEFLQIDFKIQNATEVETIIPPSFKNFKIVSGPNQQSGMSIINGKTDQYLAIGFYLKPLSPGKYTIGSAIAKVNGKEFRTEPITVEITNASGSPTPSASQSLSPLGGLGFDLSPEPATHVFDDYILKKGESVDDKVQKNLFVKLDLSKTDCYVGEPLTASYKLYTRLRSESVVTSAPSFNGFSVSELELNNNGSVKVEKYNGREYNVYTLRKVQLYPLQAGNITLDPVVTDNSVAFLRSDYAGNQKGDLFFDMLQDFANSTSPSNSVVQEHAIVKSKPVEVTVKPLPQENKPADFKGAIGNFKLNAALEKNNFTTDDAGSLKILIEGEGNIQLVNAPKVAWPDGIEGYEAKVTDDIDKFSVPMKGNKAFTFPFTISKPGFYTIPPVSFSYFEPSTGQYKRSHTSPIEVSVTAGKGNSQTSVAKNNGTEEEPSADLWQNRTYIFSGAALLMAFVFFAITLRKKNNQSKSISREPGKLPVKEMKPMQAFVVPENPLIEVHTRLVNKEEHQFYCELDASMKKYLAAKFKVPAEELTKKRINEELDKCDVGLGTSLMLNSLLDEVELNVYAPLSDSNQLEAVYDKASEVIALLEKQCVSFQ